MYGGKNREREETQIIAILYKSRSSDVELLVLQIGTVFVLLEKQNTFNPCAKYYDEPEMNM